MKPPKFKIGDAVWCDGSYGTVADIINLNEPEDVKTQGYRYEVEFPWVEVLALPIREQNQRRSIPEEILFLMGKNK